MSLVQRGAAGSLQALGEDGGRGGDAARSPTTISAEVLPRSMIRTVLDEVLEIIAITVEFIRWWNVRKRIARCQLIEGHPQKGAIAYKLQVIRSSDQPHTFKYVHPTDTITGIACTPVDEQTQSPEAEVIDGGINWKYAVIRLTPVEKGEWACDVAICTKPSSGGPAMEADSTGAAAPPAETTRAAAPSAHANAGAGPAPAPAVPANAAASAPATIPH